VSLHVPLTAATHHMIGAGTGDDEAHGYPDQHRRGAVVDSQALAGSLRAGRLAGAALDVTDPSRSTRRTRCSSYRTCDHTHIGSASHATRLKMASSRG